MLTVIWVIYDFPVVDLTTSQRSFNSQYFVSNVMTPTMARFFPHGRISHFRRLHLHLDNCHVHFSKVIEQFSTENHILHVPHPPYSPDLARQTSGFLTMSRFRSGVRPLTRQKTSLKQSPSLRGDSALGIGNRFQPLDRQGSLDFRT
jgi:hypothetical protein